MREREIIETIKTETQFLQLYTSLLHYNTMTNMKISIVPFRAKYKELVPPPHRLHCDSLARLIMRRKWDNVLDTLKAMKSHQLICSTKCCKDCSSNHGILHHVCCYQPPLSIIKFIVNSHGDGVLTEQDCLNRYPLRAAIEYDAPYPVIEYLLKKYPPAVIQKCSVDGNTPMHVAIKRYTEKAIKHKDEGDDFDFNKYFMKVIRLISEEVPLSLTQKNSNGLSPLELATQLDVRLKFDKSKPKGIIDVISKKLKIFYIEYLFRIRRRTLSISNH